MTEAKDLGLQPLDEVEGVEMNHHLAGGAYVKETRFPRGSQIVQHRHEYDHLAYLVSGWAEVINDNVRQTYRGPCALVIKAGEHHGVVALTEVVWLCIHGAPDMEPGDEITVEPVDEKTVRALMAAMKGH